MVFFSEVTRARALFLISVIEVIAGNNELSFL